MQPKSVWSQIGAIANVVKTDDHDQLGEKDFQASVKLAADFDFACGSPFMLLHALDAPLKLQLTMGLTCA